MELAKKCGDLGWSSVAGNGQCYKINNEGAIIPTYPLRIK